MTKAPALFPRIDTKKQEKPEKQIKAKKPAGKKAPLVSFKEFQKLDLRIGTIKNAEAIKGAKKLLKLTVDMGEERTVVAGLAGHYSEQDLIGKQVILVANLEPAELMGVESQGMVLAAEDGTGLHLIVPDGVTVPGSKVK
jgi:methionyl-tRNA synthetase